MIPSAKSFAVTPSASFPLTWICIVFGFFCGRHCVASTCSTSDVPMPNASDPNAPWVEVWLSPQTIVIPGKVMPEFRADDVDDALLGRIHIEQRNAKLAAIFLQRFDLLRRNRVGDGKAARSGRDVVVDGRDRAQRLPHLPSIGAQAVKGLRRSHFMHQMQVDIEQRRLPFGSGDHVRVPDLCQTECEEA